MLSKLQTSFILFFFLFNTSAVFGQDSLLVRTSFLSVQQQNKWGLADGKGNIILPTVYAEKVVVLDSNVFKVRKMGEKYGLVNNEQKQILPSSFDEIHLGNDKQFYFVKIKDLKGVYSSDFKKYLEPNYQEIQQIDSSVFQVIEEKKYAIIDKEKNKTAFTEKDNLAFIKNYFDAVTLLDSNFYVLEKDKKIGLADAAGKVILYPKYEKIGKVISLEEKQYLTIQKGKKWGIIDFKENQILAPNFPNADLLSSQIFKISEKGKHTLLSQTLDTLVANCDKIELLSNKYILYKKTAKLGLISPKGKILFEEPFKIHKFIDESHIAFQSENGLWTLFSCEVNHLFGKPKFSGFETDETSGLIIATTLKKTKAVFNTFGETIIAEGEFQKFEIRDNGLIYTQKGTKTGLISYSGKELLQPVYDAIYDFKKDTEIGITAVKRFGKWGVINKKGRLILQPKYAKLAVYKTRTIAYDGKYWRMLKYNSLGEVSSLNSTTRSLWSDTHEPLDLEITFGENAEKPLLYHWQKYGRYKKILVDKDGKNVIKQQDQKLVFDGVTTDKKQGLSLAKHYDTNNYSYTSFLIDYRTAKIVAAIDFTDVAIQDFRTQKWARTKKKNKWNGFVSKDGKRIITQVKVGGTPKDFQQVGAFNNGMAWVKIEGKFGYINTNGILVIKPMYQQADDFSHLGIAVVQKDGKFGCITKANTTRISFKYDALTIDQKATIIRGTLENLSGGLSAYGKVIIPFIFDEVLPFGDASFFWNKDQLEVRNLKLFKKFNSGIAVVKKDGDYGLVNKKGRIILPTEYKNIGFFWNGFATIQNKENLYGLIDSNGKVAIKPVYQSIGLMNKSGIGMAKKGRKWALINKNGKEITSFMYDSLSQFNEHGICLAKKIVLKGLINSKGETVLPFEYSNIDFGYADYTVGIVSQSNYVIHTHKDKDAGLSSPKGKLLVTAQLEADNLVLKKDNLVYLTKKHGKLEGYGKVDGSSLLQADYTNIENFEKIYKAKKGITKIRKDDLIGYADFNGEILVPADFKSLSDLPNNADSTTTLIAANSEGKFGLVPFQSKDSVQYQYDKITALNDSIFLTTKNTHRYFFIDTLGRSSHAVEADTMFQVVHGMAKFRRDSLWGFVNSKGDIIVEPKYEKVENFRHKIGYVKLNGKFGAVDNTGKLVIPLDYDSLEKIHYGVAIAYKEGKATYVNTEGKEFFKPGEVECKPFSHNHAIVKKGKYYGMLNPKGNWLLEPKYAAIKSSNKKGLYRLSLYSGGHRSWALADDKGTILTDFAYYKIGAFHSGLARVKTYNKKSDKRRYGFVNEKGKTVISTKYNRADNFSEGMTRLVAGKKTIYVRPNGSEIPKAIYFEHLDSLKKAKEAHLKALAAHKNNPKKVLEDDIKDESKDFEIIVLHDYKLNYKDRKGQEQILVFDSAVMVTSNKTFVKQDEIYQLTISAGGKIITKKIEGRFAYNQEVSKIISTLKENPQYKRNWRQYYNAYYKWEQTQEGNWHLMNPFMETLTKGKGYSDISAFHKGHTQVAIRGNVGLIHKNGKCILATDYEEIKQVDNHLYQLKTSYSQGYIDVNGNWIWKPKNK